MGSAVPRFPGALAFGGLTWEGALTECGLVPWECFSPLRLPAVGAVDALIVREAGGSGEGVEEVWRVEFRDGRVLRFGSRAALEMELAKKRLRLWWDCQQGLPADLLGAGFFRELWLVLNPLIIGDKSRMTLTGASGKWLAESVRLRLVGTAPAGREAGAGCLLARWAFGG